MATELDHDQIQTLLAAYALDALSEDERAAVRDHLSGCPECRGELAELAGAVAALPLTVAEREPSPELRERLRGAALASLNGRAAGDHTILGAPPRAAAEPAPRSPRRSQRWWRSAAIPWAAAAALLVLSLGMLVWNLQLQRQTTVLTAALQTTSAAPRAQGQLIYLKDRGVIIMNVRDLPALPAGEVYEIWLIQPPDQGANPIPSGVFASTSARVALAATPAGYQAIAITIEHGPLGSPTPAGDKVVVTPLAPLGG